MSLSESLASSQRYSNPHKIILVYDNKLKLKFTPDTLWPFFTSHFKNAFELFGMCGLAEKKKEVSKSKMT